MTNKLFLLFATASLCATSMFAQCNSSASFSSIAAAEINSKMCATETFTVGTGGVTANTVVITDTSNPTKIVAGTGSGAYGVALSTVSAAGSVQVARYGQVLCVMENAATAGHLVIGGVSTPADCRDSGQTASSAISINTRIIGVLLSSASSGATATVSLTPAHYGTLVSAGSSVYAASQGPTALITETGSPVVVYSQANVPALAANSCYRITYATQDIANAVNEYLYIDSTQVAHLQSTGGSGVNWLESDFLFCNAIGTQSTQSLTAVGGGYSTSGGGWNPTVSAGTMFPAVTSVDMSVSHTFSIESQQGSGSTQGMGFRIGQ